MIAVEGLVKTFPGRRGLFARPPVPALREVAFNVGDGAAVAVIGESGSGKTTLGRIVAGLERYERGRIEIDGEAVDGLPGGERRKRFQRVQLVHQDPYAALNPTRTIGQTMHAVLSHHAQNTSRGGEWAGRRQRELLEMVGLNPDVVLARYPHELSGGQRQRVVIARALTVDPTVLVADEAVSMIDVSLRLGILQLLAQLRERLGLALIFITHDVAVARYVAREGEIFVLYRGRVVERGATEAVLARPLHPYTQALLSAVPVMRGLERPGPDRFIPRRPLEEAADADAEACGFAPRCPFAQDRCGRERPALVPAGDGDDRHLHACFFPERRRVVPEEVG